MCQEKVPDRFSRRNQAILRFHVGGVYRGVRCGPAVGGGEDGEEPAGPPRAALVPDTPLSHRTRKVERPLFFCLYAGYFKQFEFGA